jgi:hypothetical protein
MTVEQPTTVMVDSLGVPLRARAGSWDSIATVGRRQIFAWWLGTRILVFITAAIVQISRFPRSQQLGFLGHPFVLLESWDSHWYRIIAGRGYLLVPHQYSDPAFFPLLPIVERLGAVIGLPYVVTGALVANLGFLAGLMALYALGCELLPETDARRSAIYLAIFPMGFVFALAYPEGLVLPLVALAGLFAVRDRWLAAAVCAAAATLARPEGLFLALPLAAIALRRWTAASDSLRARSLAAVLAPAAALASFSGYLWWTLGDPLAWSKAERAWGRSFSAHGIRTAFTQLLIAPSHHNGWVYRDVVFCVLYVVLLVVALRAGLPRSWIAAGAATVLLPIASGSFTSDARFGLLVPPIFWGLAILGRRRALDRALLALCPLLLIAGVVTLPLRWP